MKKHISFIIILAMLLALLPGTALAWAPDSDDYTISTAAELQAFATAVNDGNTFEGKIVTLTSDIDLSGIDWTPIGTDSIKFNGEFNGNGKTIRNMNVVADVCGGLFHSLDRKSNVHDLTIDGVTANGVSDKFGTLAHYIHLGGAELSGIKRIKNITVKNVSVTVTSSSARAGGICSRAESEWALGSQPVGDGHGFENCKVEKFTVVANNGIGFAGGFVAISSASDIVYENCDVTGFKIIVGTGSSKGCVGGFAALTQTRDSYGTYNNCDVTGLDITVAGDVCAAGFICDPGSETHANNCTTQGNIDASGVTNKDYYISGFFGSNGFDGKSNKNNYSATSCTADVDITTGGAIASGFIGTTMGSDSNAFTFDNCKSTGDVTSNGGMAGGFAGVADRGTYNNCTTSGTVSSTSGYAGGLIGNAATNSNGLTITLSGNTNGTNVAKDIGNVADDVTINGLIADPSMLDFGTKEVGYTGVAAQTVTVENTTGKEYTLSLPTTSEYNVDVKIEAPVDPVAAVALAEPDGVVEKAPITLSAGGKAIISINPVDGLGAGKHDAKLMFTLQEDSSSTPSPVTLNVSVKFNVTAPTSAPTSPGSGISLWYNGGNSFGSSKSAVPTSVEINGKAVSFTGTGSQFTVSCVPADAKWVTVRWNSTTVTTNFTPDARAACAAVAIPKTGDMPLWVAIAEFFGF